MNNQKTPLHDYTLDDWVVAFDQVYGVLDQRRTSEGIMLHLVEHASKIQEDLRVGQYHHAVTHLADTICWVCGVVVKSHERYGIETSYHEQVLRKFPRRCYHCLESRCICSATTGSAIDLDQAAKNRAREQNKHERLIHRKTLRTSNNEPKSLLDLEQMFINIYAHVNFSTPLEYIIAHFQEEVGEAAECINELEDLMQQGLWDVEEGRKRREHWCEELELELADIFTWAMALLLKFDYMLGSAKIFLTSQTEIKTPQSAPLLHGRPPQSIELALPQVLWDRFGVPGANPEEGLRLCCPRCGKTPCSCASIR